MRSRSCGEIGRYILYFQRPAVGNPSSGERGPASYRRANLQLRTIAHLHGNGSEGRAELQNNVSKIMGKIFCGIRDRDNSDSFISFIRGFPIVTKGEISVMVLPEGVFIKEWRKFLYNGRTIWPGCPVFYATSLNKCTEYRCFQLTYCRCQKCLSGNSAKKHTKLITGW